MEKQSVLIVLGKGGHTEQMLRLVDSFGRRYDYEYVLIRGDSLSKQRIRIPGKLFFIKNPREMGDKSSITVFFKLFKTTFDSLNVLSKSKSKFIVTCGPGMAMPFSILGKLLFRKKLVFIESWSRVSSKSLAGKYLYPLADISFIQWIQEKKNYPGASYSGRLG